MVENIHTPHVRDLQDSRQGIYYLTCRSRPQNKYTTKRLVGGQDNVLLTRGVESARDIGGSSKAPDSGRLEGLKM